MSIKKTDVSINNPKSASLAASLGLSITADASFCWLIMALFFTVVLSCPAMATAETNLKAIEQVTVVINADC